MMHEPGAAHPTFIVSVRIDSRDLARLIIFWNQQGTLFQSRSELLRATLELFIQQNKIEEVSSVRAGGILGEEFYRKSKRQEAISLVVERAQEELLNQVQSRLAKTAPLSMEELLDQIPVEEVSPIKTIKEGEQP